MATTGGDIGRVTRVRLRVIGPFSVDAGAAQRVNPFELVRLDASLSSGTADAWLWQQTSGPTVTMTVVDGDPTAVTFKAPATRTGTALGFTVTATSGGATATDTVVVTVTQHVGLWQYQGSTLVGINTWSGLGGQEPTTPTAPPMPTASYTSTVTGQAWQYVYGEDFTTDVALGGFTTMTTGSDLGLLNPASTGGAIYAASWKAKQNNSPDTSGNALYSAVKTMSVANSVLDMWLHKESGQAYGSAVKPLIPGGAPGPNFLPHCRVEFRMRHTGIVGSGFGCVGLLINNNFWPIYGEDDWPETQLGGNVGGFRHPAQSTNSSIPVGGGGRVMTDWHRFAIEWLPWSTGSGARVRYLVDDQVMYDTTTLVAVDPATLGFLIQAGSNGGAVPDGAEGHVQIDWIAIWKAAV